MSAIFVVVFLLNAMFGRAEQQLCGKEYWCMRAKCSPLEEHPSSQCSCEEGYTPTDDPRMCRTITRIADTLGMNGRYEKRLLNGRMSRAHSQPENSRANPRANSRANSQGFQHGGGSAGRNVNPVSRVNDGRTTHLHSNQKYPRSHLNSNRQYPRTSPKESRSRISNGNRQRVRPDAGQRNRQRVRPDAGQRDAPVGGGVEIPTRGVHPVEPSGNQAKTSKHSIWSGNSSPRMDSNFVIIYALIGFFGILFIVFFLAEVARKKREKKADSTRLLKVFQYLHDFNVDDVDIQLSAAGGFHVGYLNGLAQGVNTKKQGDQETEATETEAEGSGVDTAVLLSNGV